LAVRLHEQQQRQLPLQEFLFQRPPGRGASLLHGGAQQPAQARGLQQRQLMQLGLDGL
jgi:hypothetical protein